MTLRYALLQVSADQSAAVEVKGHRVRLFSCKEHENQNDGNSQELYTEQYADLYFFFHNKHLFNQVMMPPPTR